jgi:hypothetical protein
MKALRWTTLASSFCSTLIARGQSPKPKKVLFIVVDDLRTELGCDGVDGVISPNIGHLAKRGSSSFR